jgi:hypothetical protein
MTDQPQHVLRDAVWSVVVPEESTNLINNPSFETDTSGWLAFGSGVSVSRVTSQSFSGVACALMSDSSATGSNEYIYTTVSVSPNTQYTLSFRYQKACIPSGTGTVYIFIFDSGSSLIATQSKALKPGNVSKWTYDYLSINAPATAASAQLLFATNGVTSGSFSLWIDSVQFEAKPYPTTYIDGDQEGCQWLGNAHSSQSYRNAQTRKGGRVLKLSHFGFSLTAMIGLGAAALTTIATPYALAGGGYYQRSVAPPRQFSLVGGFECRSDAELKARRAELFKALNPNLTVTPQPARMIYTPANCDVGSGDEIIIDAVYNGGLEGNWTNDMGQERVALTFTTYLPFAAIGTKQQVFSATTQSDVAYSSLNGLITQRLSDGEWWPQGGSPGGPNGEVVAVAVDPRNSDIYIGGLFTTVGGVTVNRIAKFDSATRVWSALSTGMNDAVYALTFGADGNLYAAGLFTTSGGVTTNRIAKWNGSAWSAAVGSGANAAVHALAFYNGSLYVGGSFTTLNGTAAGGIAYYDGSTVTSLSSFTTDGVGALLFGTDGTLYAFSGPNAVPLTSINGVSVSSVAMYRNGVWSNMNGGAVGTNIVRAAVVSPSGRILFGGSFTSIGGVSAGYLAWWNGSGFASTNANTNTAITALMYLPNGHLLIGGTFTTIGGFSQRALALWDGTNYMRYDMQPNGGSPTRISAMASNQFAAVFAGDFSSATVPVSLTVTRQSDGSKYQATFTFGSVFATPVSLRNWTTGDFILFKPELNAVVGEKFTLYLEATPRLISETRGDVTAFITTSNAGFRVISGTNYISFYTGSGTIYYREVVTSISEAY